MTCAQMCGAWGSPWLSSPLADSPTPSGTVYLTSWPRWSRAQHHSYTYTPVTRNGPQNSSILSTHGEWKYAFIYGVCLGYRGEVISIVMLNYIVSYESCSCWQSMQSGCIGYGIDLNSIGVYYMCPCQHLNDIYISISHLDFCSYYYSKEHPRKVAS